MLLQNLTNINSTIFTNTLDDSNQKHFVTNSNITNESKTCVNWNYYYKKCRPSDENPFKGAISFDNIANSWLAILQIISLENWVTIMYYIQDAHSFWNWIYFAVLILVNLNLNFIFLQ